MTSEQVVRKDLAAAFRWAARLGLHEAVANHFSAAVPGAGSMFLLNPKGRHFSRMRASELLLLDAVRPGRPTPTLPRTRRRGTSTVTCTGPCPVPA